MTTTPHLSLALVETAQAQKEVTVNEALMRLDALLNTGAIDKDIATPPVSPTAGDVYIVAPSPTGAWAGKAGQVAYFDQVWQFISPREGATLWVNDEDSLYIYYGGGAWGRVARSGGRQTLYVPASQMQPSVNAGCAARATVALGTGQPDITTHDFDASTQEHAQFSVRLPKAWDEGAVTVVVEWSHAAAAGTFGVVWGIAGASAGDGDPLTISFGAAQEVTDTGGTTDALYKSPETGAIGLSGSAAKGDTFSLRLYRKAADPADTLAVDARVHGVTFFYTTHSINDD